MRKGYYRAYPIPNTMQVFFTILLIAQTLFQHTTKHPDEWERTAERRSVTTKRTGEITNFLFC